MEELDVNIKTVDYSLMFLALVLVALFSHIDLALGMTFGIGFFFFSFAINEGIFDDE